jgi:hypothetical protein
MGWPAIQVEPWGGRSHRMALGGGSATPKDQKFFIFKISLALKCGRSHPHCRWGWIGQPQGPN